MTAANELLPCPFCGGSPTLHVGIDNHTTGHGETSDVVRVACTCGVQVDAWHYSGYQHQERTAEVTTAWNRRAQTAEAVDEDKEYLAFEKWFDATMPGGDLLSAWPAWMARARGGN